jgi:hypothetical protein
MCYDGLINVFGTLLFWYLGFSVFWYLGSSTPYVRFIGSINFISILLRRERHARHDPLVVTPNPRLKSRWRILFTPLVKEGISLSPLSSLPSLLPPLLSPLSSPLSRSLTLILFDGFRSLFAHVRGPCAKSGLAISVRDKESLVTVQKSEMCYLGGISPMEAEAAAYRLETEPLGFQLLTLSAPSKKRTQ